MTQDKQTNRQIQAQQTKDKVYQVAIHLFETKGFENITVDEICKASNVSTGTFYNVFKSKYEILDRIFELADIYFSEKYIDMKKCPSTKECILNYFDCYADYNQKCGLEFTKQLYNVKNNLFAKDNRIMQNILNDIILEGQGKNEITSSIKSIEIVQFLFVCVRGVVYDWCLRDGRFDLKNRIHEYVSRLIQTL